MVDILSDNGIHLQPLNVYNMYIYIYIYIFPVALRPNEDHGLLIAFYITHNDASQSVGLLWTIDQPVARDLYLTTHNTHNKHPCPQWNSKPRSQQASGRRTTP